METHNIIASQKLRGTVLQQVYRVWLFRKLLPVLLLEVGVLAAVLYGLGRVVFIQRVIENGLNVLFLNPSAIFSFVAEMFLKAPVMAQALGIGVLILVALVIRHVTQGALRLILVRENFFGKVRN